MTGESNPATIAKTDSARVHKANSRSVRQIRCFCGRKGTLSVNRPNGLLRPGRDYAHEQIVRTTLLPIVGTALLCCVAVPSDALANPLAGERHTNPFDEIHQASLRLNKFDFPDVRLSIFLGVSSCKDL